MPTEKTPQVFIHDDLHPEDGAMLQALYSRSPASVQKHIEKVRAADTGKFMSTYYVGYGHASIGDCGVTNIFVENVSMLVAKAIQDNPLYSGQEASTRYLDFSTQPMVDPYNHPESRKILDQWMALYNRWLPRLQGALAQKHPFESGGYKNEKVWQNAVNARAFDIMRAFLPVGTTTLLSWTTNLRQARDRLMSLKHHPLAEVREVALDIYTQLLAKYPHSFNGEEMADEGGRYAERDAYARKNAIRDNFESWEDISRRFHFSAEEAEWLRGGEIISRTNAMDVDALNDLEGGLLSSRPAWAPLPRRLASYGSYNLAFLIDFGSYRDIQRHRNGLCQVPLIDATFGFHPWYLNELRALLPKEYPEIEEALEAQLESIDALENMGSLHIDPLKTQYLYPMGMQVAAHVSYSLPQTVYVAELRAGKTVHPTLRPVAQNMAKLLEENHPGIALHIDWSEDKWVAKRGEQTIVAQAS